MCSYNSSCTLDEYFLLKEVTKITKRTTEHYIYKYKDEIYILAKFAQWYQMRHGS